MNWFDPNSEHWLDSQLRDVPVPEGLAERWRSVSLEEDADLDALLNDVPAPAGLVDRLERIARRPVPSGRAYRVAMAACLFVAAGLGFLTAVTGLLRGIAGTGPPLPVALSTGETEPSASYPVPPTEFLAGPASSPVPAEPPAALVDLLGPIGPRDHRPLEMEDLRPTGIQTARPGLPPVWEPDTLRNGPLDSDSDRWGVFGTHARFDALPELKKLAGLTPRGMDFPVVPGYDVAWLAMTGVHPFVFPAYDPALCKNVVPLDVDTASYELTWRYLEDGQLPPPERIRTEEFLAAIDYDLPRPGRTPVGLTLDAGPSLTDNRLRLIQIGVQAGDVPLPRREDVHLVLAVDVSASMRWGGRLEMVHRALADLVGRLQPGDRVSLIAFSEEAVELADSLPPEQAEAFREALGRLKVGSSTNVGQGLRETYALAERERKETNRACRVVLLTDGLAGLEPAVTERLADRLAEAAQHGITFHAIDLGIEPESTGGDGRAAELTTLTQAGRGTRHRARSVDQIRWAALEILSGRSQVVASKVRLEVTFEPEVVMAYRLLGHEPSALTGMEPARVELDFHSGQSATACYEVALLPKRKGLVATARLSWLDAHTGQRQEVVRSISYGRLTSTQTIWDASPNVQLAALAAMSAEVLRGSPFARVRPMPITVYHLLAVARSLDPRIQARPSTARFISMLEQAQRARPARRQPQGH
ncbi:MAG: von Willebrand factor type A domain-containing protein [Pirellulales bacterium]|nr:von Willebrand factor type A domain-containing protein [Pirellulales bacterium]